MEWLTLFGYTFIALVLRHLLQSLYRVVYPFFVAEPIDLHAKAGSNWAVVTGATDGIGKQFAFQLAEKNFNLYLISRTKSRLDATKKEIEQKYPRITVRFYAFDFSASTAEAYEPLIKDLQTIPIGVLVNNVGMAMDCPELLHEQGGGRKELAQIHTVNTLSALMMCSAALEQMSARKAGVIINVASAAGLNHMPLWAAYSASKRYLMHLSHIIRLENPELTVQCLTPMGVDTKMMIFDVPKIICPPAEVYVKFALRTIGIVNETTGYVGHQIQAEIFNLFPTALLDRLVMSVNQSMRRDLKAKLEAQNKKE